MDIEDKKLLIIDLCNRIPYDLKVSIKLPNYENGTFDDCIGDLEGIDKYGVFLVNVDGIDYRTFKLDIKPYLRSLSSMTNAEKIIYRHLLEDGSYYELVDFCNERRLDYRGLIEKGLAIKVTKKNNPYKQV